MHLFRLFAFSVIVVLTACAPRGVVTVFPDAALVGQVQNVFVATTRYINSNGSFTNKRTPTVSYHRYDISIPPEHEIGEIDWPRGKIDPRKAFFTTEVSHFDGGQEFAQNLAIALQNRPIHDREVVIFVHGFNNTFADGLYRLAQLSNDMALPNPTVHYSWPSAASPFGYGYDRDSLLFGRDGLEALIKAVKSSGASSVLLVGHSLGSLQIMETLRQMAIADVHEMRQMVSSVILISPDIDVDLFRQQAARIGPLPQPFVIFTSKKDRALRLSARLSGKHDRLGNVQDVRELSNLSVTLLDVTKFSDGITGHFNAATSPALLQILKRLRGLDAAFQNDPSGRAGLIPGTVLTVQQATQIILTPALSTTP